MSEFIREIVAEKINIEELISKIEIPEAIEIPDYIPKNKYVIFVNGAVVSVGDNCTISRKEQISTVTGIIEATIYKGNVKILETIFEIEFIIAPIADILPFKFLIGRNLMDQLDAYFLGKKQVLLLKIAES